MKRMIGKFRGSAALLLAAAIGCGGNQDSSQREATPGTGELNLVSTIGCAPTFNKFVGPPPAGALPFVPLASLKIVDNPVVTFSAKGAPIVRADLVSYIANAAAAIQLGKAFFWDVQAGSDNKVSCATCHFQGGEDTRTRNQLNPGFNGGFDGLATNYNLTATDFPFVDPALSRDADNVAGSQGVRKSNFVGIGPTGAETTIAVSDPVFGTLRQVTGVNAPSTINAVFNHRNFFNGRAQNEFNGVNPFGNRDSSAHIYYGDSLGIYPTAVTIKNAALASQAVGPPLNPVEMSADGRTFPDLAKKLLLLKPLGLQKVDATDSVLGGLAESKAKGLKTTYAALIQKAFQPSLWNSTATVTLNNKPYTLTQANFSFFWGMAVMLYEATLVSNNSPMDQYVATRTFDLVGNLTSHNPALLDPVLSRLAAEGTTVPIPGGSRAVTRADILLGLDLFERPLPLPTVAGLPPGTGVGCSLCHVGAETTSASIRNLTVGVEAGDVAFKNAGFDLRMERMFMGVRSQPFPAPQPPPPVPFGTDIVTYDNGNYSVTVNSINGVMVAPQAMTVNTYDSGWYDVGIRPVIENPGLGGLDPFGNPLSWTEFLQKSFANPETMFKVAGGGLTCIDANGKPVTPPAAPLTSPFVGEVLDPGTGLPILSGGLFKTEATDVAGSFKTPQLRNVELNGPYFHSGGKATLRQVVDFYDDGGNFANATLSPLIRPLGLTEDQKTALIAFLVSLTDDRVRLQQAPFDHPELVVPAGQDATGADLTISIPAVGAAGSTTPVKRFLNLNPFQM